MGYFKKSDIFSRNKYRMKTYLVSDTHFNHTKLVEYSGRPENFDELIWKGLKELPKDCLLIHLGDICIGGDEEVHMKWKKLLFKKILVKGNHDGHSNKWYLERGWDFISKEFIDSYFGKRILFSHKPVKYTGQYDFNIHGHFHNNNHRIDDEEFRGILDSNKQLLISLELQNYKPVNLEEFLYEKL